MRTLSTPIQRAEALASRQESAIATFQAIEAGMSQDQIDHAVRTGRWRRPLRGVCCIAGSAATPQQVLMVAFLAVSRAGGVVSHISAAAIWGLLPWSTLPHVLVPPGRGHRCPGARVHRGAVAPVDRAHRNGMVVTSVSRTIVDLASILDRPTLEQVVDDALCRKLASVQSIEAVMARMGRGHRGLTNLRAVLEAWSPGITPGSPAEVRLLRQAAGFGLTGLVPQFEVVDEDGAFVARVDLALPASKKALEYEGINPHNPRRWSKDEPRYARLRALGWEIETIGKLDLCPGEPRLREIAGRWTS